MAKAAPLAAPTMVMSGDLATNWEAFEDGWTNYALATELNKKDDQVIVATLLTVIGPECFKIYKNLLLSDDERKCPSAILAKLREEFQGKRNIIYDRYIFNSAIQEANEPFDIFFNRLRELSKTYKYELLE